LQHRILAAEIAATSHCYHACFYWLCRAKVMGRHGIWQLFRMNYLIPFNMFAESLSVTISRKKLKTSTGWNN
jgi:hypothetical protein